MGPLYAIVRQKAIELKFEGKHDGKMVGGWLVIKKPEKVRQGRDPNKILKIPNQYR